MNKNIVVLVIFAFIFSFYANAKQNLRIYYKYVAAAENCIIEDDYDNAAKYYRKAFVNKDFIFENDLLNAIYCEVKSKNPSKEYCQIYSAQSGYDLYKKFKDFDGIDSTFFVKNIKQSDYTQIREQIRKMRELDQKYRKNYNPKDTMQSMQLFNADLTNFVQFSILLDSINLFDERIINFDEIAVFFNHWSVNYLSISDFLPKMLQSINEGVMDARKFAADVGDILFWRKNPESPFSPYGTQLLTIYRATCGENDISKSKYIAFFNFNSNDKEVKKKIKEIDKKRESIFLGSAFESNLNDFKLWLKCCGYSYDNLGYLYPQPQQLVCEKNAEEILNKELLKNPNLLYYFTGEHDFNNK